MPAVNLPLEGQRKRDLDELQRQTAAAALAQLKVVVDWREHKLAELVDWRERVEVATLIYRDQGLILDWRSMTVAELNDIRLRSAKATELAASHGVAVDWRLYSWRQLEEIRRAVLRIQAAESPATAEARQRKGMRPTPTAIPAVTKTRPRDKDPITDI
jgi:hypothetical protein